MSKIWHRAAPHHSDPLAGILTLFRKVPKFPPAVDIDDSIEKGFILRAQAAADAVAARTRIRRFRLKSLYYQPGKDYSIFDIGTLNFRTV